MEDHTHSGHEFAEDTDKMVANFRVADYRLLMDIPRQISDLGSLLRVSISETRAEISVMRADMALIRRELTSGLESADSKIAAANKRVDGLNKAYWKFTAPAAGIGAGIGMSGTVAWALFTSWDKVKALFVAVPPHH